MPSSATLTVATPSADRACPSLATNLNESYAPAAESWPLASGTNSTWPSASATSVPRAVISAPGTGGLTLAAWNRLPRSGRPVMTKASASPSTSEARSRTALMPSAMASLSKVTATSEAVGASFTGMTLMTTPWRYENSTPL